MTQPFSDLLLFNLEQFRKGLQGGVAGWNVARLGICSAAAGLKNDVAQMEDAPEDTVDVGLLLGGEPQQLEGVLGEQELAEVVDPVDDGVLPLGEVVELLRLFQGNVGHLG